MRALQMDMLQRRRDLADGCKGLSSGSPLPMGFHSSSNNNPCPLMEIEVASSWLREGFTYGVY